MGVPHAYSDFQKKMGKKIITHKASTEFLMFSSVPFETHRAGTCLVANVVALKYTQQQPVPWQTGLDQVVHGIVHAGDGPPCHFVGKVTLW